MFGSKKILEIDDIINALNNGEKFGLFEANKPNGGTYYFENGSKIRNEDLWEALRIKNNLEKGHGKTLKELCPENFIGIFYTSNKKHNWRKTHS